ncbi:MAG: RDD family protein [Kiritimatiellales bacterium]|nr:RDD family protein [Kiritimatiellales bacterium]
MDSWYYKKNDNDQENGPFTAIEIQQLFETRLIPSNTRVRAEGSGEWIAAREVAQFKRSIGLPPSIASRHAHPWCRYWARVIDIQLSIIFLAIPVGILLALLAPELKIPDLLLIGILMTTYVFIEPIFLATIGTTAGKALFRIRLRKADGRKLSYGEALKRSFEVLIKGLGALLPIISFFTMISSYQRLSNNGITSWDEGRSLLVSHRRLGVVRLIFIIPIIAASILISILRS